MGSRLTSYENLQSTQTLLRHTARIARYGCGFVGISLFANSALRLRSTGFELGERVTIGLLALVYLAGFAFLGVLVARVLESFVDLVEVWMDQAVASQKLVAILENEISPQLGKVSEAIRSAALSAQTAVPAVAATAPTPSNRSPRSANASASKKELLEQLRMAKEYGEADEVLDLRELLMDQLDDAKRSQLDVDLARWFSKYFQKALRAGRAPLVVDALGRAVDALGEIDEMKPLRDSLPTVRQSAGLCPGCGRPYRGQHSLCGFCREAEAVSALEERKRPANAAAGPQSTEGKP